MSPAVPHPRLHFWLHLAPVLGGFLLAAWQMRYDWTYDETYYYGWVVTPLMAYLCSVRWRDRPAPQPVPLASRSPWGWAVVAFLVPVVWLIREANPEWRLVGLALALLAIAAALVWLQELGGSAWRRHFAGAISFFAVSIPWPSQLEKITAHTLMPANASVAMEALNWLGTIAVRAGNMISLPGGVLGVEEACSGIRSLQATLMMVLFLGEMHRLRWWHRLILLGLGVLIALLTNALRTIWLSVVGAQSGMAATHHWHDRAGLIVLAINTAALIFLTNFIERKFPRPPLKLAPAAALTRYARSYTRGPLWALAALLAMLPLSAYWYGRHEAPQAETWTLTQPTEAPGYATSYVNDLTTKMLRYTRAWSAKWQTDQQQPFHAFYLEWDRGQSPPDNMNVHTPGGCLLNLGIEQQEEYPVVLVDLQGHQMPFRFLRFRDRNRPLYLLYFAAENKAPGETDDVGSFDFSYSKRLRSVLAGRRNPGQRLVEIGLWDVPDPAAALTYLTDYLKKHLLWQPAR